MIECPLQLKEGSDTQNDGIVVISRVEFWSTTEESLECFANHHDFTLLRVSAALPRGFPTPT